jgi:nucleoside 2-deoxyribosyltransferase
VTLYNDISKDEGISFEIGYAYGRRVPIFVLNTDFIWYALRSNPKYEFVVDPVIQNMVYKYLHSYEIHNEEDVFINNLYSGLTRAFKKMEEELYNFLLSPSNYKTKSFEFSCKLKNVFIDFCGGKCEYHRSYMEKLKKKIQKLGVNVTTSIRFDPKIDFKDIKLIERGKIDIENLLKSSVVIFSAEEPEMDSGSAALLGLAKALNKEIILYYSGNIEIHGDGGHKMIKNLMIDYSVDYFCNKFHMIPNIVEETLGEE